MSHSAIWGVIDINGRFNQGGCLVFFNRRFNQQAGVWLVHGFLATCNFSKK
jgi:hypothetical protein